MASSVLAAATPTRAALSLPILHAASDMATLSTICTTASSPVMATVSTLCTSATSEAMVTIGASFAMGTPAITATIVVREHSLLRHL